MLLPDLLCEVLSFSYNFETKEGRLDMPIGNCCDMNGCINLFKKIDSGVREVKTFSGGILDASYSGIATGWEARLYSKA
jgi:hypothetical protein